MDMLLLENTPIFESQIQAEAEFVLPPHMELVDGQRVEKQGGTLKHGRIQSKLSTLWTNHQHSQNLGGQVYTEPPCRTVGKQIRRPDVAYLTPLLLSELGQSNILPQSFPLIAEIVSPTDLAEEVLGKANEYLSSGAEEVWLVFPESQWVIVLTSQQKFLFAQGEVARTHFCLPGFSVAVSDLLA